MDWLNYHHLLYFWTVARHGSITAASKELRLAQSTISGQISTLEDSLGEELFARVGRNLVLTEVGQVVFRYADEIFNLGRELTDALKGRPTGSPLKFRVGIPDVMPKLMSHRLLEPVLAMQDEVQLVCHENKTDRLLADLAVHGLDLVLADAPLPATANVKAYNHLLGECGLSFFAVPTVAHGLCGDFPGSLDGAPMLMPTPNTHMRRSLDIWLGSHALYPRIVAEVEDSALLKVFGEHGAGVFAAPTIVESEILTTHDVVLLGRTEEVRERFYAITLARHLKHPAAVAIKDHARETLFTGIEKTEV